MSNPIISGNGVSPQALQKWVNQTDNQFNAITNRIARLQNLHVQVSDQVDTVVTATGVPPYPNTCSVSVAGVILNGQVWQEVTATYTSPSPLGNFAGVFLVLQNYRGSSQLVKEAEDTYAGPANTSKSFKFRLDKTSENVTFYFVPKNTSEGTVGDWTKAPNVSATLNVDAGSITSTLPTSATSPLNVRGVLIGGSPLSQVGNTKTIQIASFGIQFGFGQINYNSGSVTPTALGTWNIYFDDPNYQGGAVTYNATQTDTTVTAADGRLFIGQITTISGGGGSGSGGSGFYPGF